MAHGVKSSLKDKVYAVFLIIIKATLIIAIIASWTQGSYEVLLLSLLTLFLVYVPILFEKSSSINIPLELEALIVIFIYASLFLGSAQGYYTYFWWWDSLLHAVSAIFFGFIGFFILYVLYKEEKITAGPFIIAVFSFFFALGIGGLWEIIEYGIDSGFGINMQETGLPDTMGDLIMDSIGALIASVGGYYYLKGNEHFLFRRFVYGFFRDNPSIFRSFKTKRRLERKILRLHKRQQRLQKKIEKIRRLALRKGLDLE